MTASHCATVVGRGPELKVRDGLSCVFCRGDGPLSLSLPTVLDIFRVGIYFLINHLKLLHENIK